MDRKRIAVASLVVVMVTAACGGQRGADLESAPVEPDGDSFAGEPTSTIGSPSTTMEIDVKPVGVPDEGDGTPTAVDLTDAGSEDPSPQLGALAAQIADARERWAIADISTYHYRGEVSYDAEVEPGRFCGLGRPFTSHVVDGAAVEATGVDGCEVALDDPGRPPLTIEEWFDFLDRMITGTPDAFVFADSATELTVFFAESSLPSIVRWQGETSWTEFWISSATTGQADTSQADDLLAALATAQGRWDSAGITDYRYQVLLDCFCLPETVGPFDVTVRGGTVIDATVNGQPADDEHAPVEVFTVPGLFAEVAGSTEFDRIDVEFEPTHGFPILIDADPRDNTSDDESTLR